MQDELAMTDKEGRLYWGSIEKSIGEDQRLDNIEEKLTQVCSTGKFYGKLNTLYIKASP